MKQTIAIVGRPNVGKSTLFNRIAGKRQALVNDMEGVTRDRHYATAQWCGREFTMIDTGGLVQGRAKSVQHFIKKQTLTAIEEANIIICVFDGKSGPVTLDGQIVELLRNSKKPVFYAVNKLDADIGKKRGKGENIVLPDAALFYELGISPKEQLFPISAEHGRGVDEMLDEVLKLVGTDADSLPNTDLPDHLRVAVIGRPNAGKSTLVNRLFGSERVIAHEMPGTTRDSIDVEVQTAGKKYIFVDTAGLRKKGKTIETLDKYTAVKTLKSIENVTLVLLMIDANEGFTHQDSFLLDHAFVNGKGVIVLFNKWDALKTDEKELKRFYTEKLLRLHRVPFLCISAKTGLNVDSIFRAIDKMSARLKIQLSTSTLNKLLASAQSSRSLPAIKGRAIKLYYATQVNINPPAFIIFANHPDDIATSYKRFLINKIQDLIGDSVPVRIVFKQK